MGNFMGHQSLSPFRLDTAAKALGLRLWAAIAAVAQTLILPKLHAYVVSTANVLSRTE
jgi:hypothetical protein